MSAKERAAGVMQARYVDLSRHLDAYFMNQIVQNETTQDAIAVV